MNNNNLTLNVRNFNNRIGSVNIHNLSEDQKAKMTSQQLKTQRYSRENSLNKNMEDTDDSNPVNQSAKAPNKTSSN